MTKSADQLEVGEEVLYQQVWKTIKKKSKGTYFPNSWEIVFTDGSGVCWSSASLVFARRKIKKAV